MTEAGCSEKEAEKRDQEEVAPRSFDMLDSIMSRGRARTPPCILLTRFSFGCRVPGVESSAGSRLDAKSTNLAFNLAVDLLAQGDRLASP
jgi:hypothetical protein